MMKHWLGVFAALTMVGAAGCSSSGGDGGGGSPLIDSGAAGDTNGGGDTGGSGTDTGPAKDTGTRPDVTPIEGGGGDGGGDATPPPDEGKTTGKACTSDGDCDVKADGVNLCSNDAFSPNDYWPTPICVGNSCTPATDPTKLAFCDGNTGVCLPQTGGKGVCFPTCTFSPDSGAAPSGCVGKDTCRFTGYGPDPADPAGKKLIGYGICFGGCSADADCPTGNKCQVETGLCKAKTVAYALKPGAPCVAADASSTPPKCNCIYDASSGGSGTGYCVTSCVVGGSAGCDTGYTCSPGLPTVDSAGGALFSKDPAGMYGKCLKTCATDSDCTALNAFCNTTATGKVCEPAKI